MKQLQTLFEPFLLQSSHRRRHIANFHSEGSKPLQRMPIRGPNRSLHPSAMDPTIVTLYKNNLAHGSLQL